MRDVPAAGDVERLPQRYASDEELVTRRSCYHCLRANRSKLLPLSPYCTLLGRTVDFCEAATRLKPRRL